MDLARVIQDFSLRGLTKVQDLEHITAIMVSEMERGINPLTNQKDLASLNDSNRKVFYTN
jgi:hypothetical protein